MYRRAMLRAEADATGLTPDAPSGPPDSGTRPAPATNRAGSEAAADPPAFPPPAHGPRVTRARPVSRRPRGPAVLAVMLFAVAALVLVLPWRGAEAPDAFAVDQDPPALPAPGAVGQPSPSADDPVERAAPADSDVAFTPAIEADASAAPPPPPPPVSRPLATEGTLVVVSDPPGALVTVNGIGWGATPVTIRHVPFGEKRVRVIRDGYGGHERVIRLAAQQPDATVRVTLRPID